MPAISRSLRAGLATLALGACTSFLDAPDAAQGVQGAVQVEPFRGRLQQHPQGRAQDRPRGPQQHQAEGHAEQWVDSQEPGEPDHQRRDDDDEAFDI